jgi:hypothetical protein
MQTLAEAQHAGQQGALTAAQHADWDSMGWTQKASILFLDYARDVMLGQPFLTEDARAYAETKGLALPPDNRAWGFIAKAMRESGHIVFAGYAPAKSSNGSPKCQWRLW